MPDQSRPRGRYAGLLALAVFAASAVVGWRVLSERSASTVDDGGFDVGAAPASRRAAPAAASAPAAPLSGLELMRVDEEIREAPPAGRGGGNPAPAPLPAAVSARTLAQTRLEFTAQTRRDEGAVRAFAERMTAKSPVIRQYGRDWMSHPDLKKLNDDYMRDHDPIAFLAGLARAPSFPAFVRQYAGEPDVRSFVVLGLANGITHDLGAAGLNLMRDDPSLKGTITEVGTALGLPPDLAASLGARDPKKPLPAAKP